MEACRPWRLGSVSARFELGESVIYRGAIFEARETGTADGRSRRSLRRRETTCDWGDIDVHLFYDVFVRETGEVCAIGPTYARCWPGWEHVSQRSIDRLGDLGAEPRSWGPEGVLAEWQGERIPGELVRDYWRFSTIVLFRSPRLEEAIRSRLQSGASLDLGLTTATGAARIRLELPCVPPRPHFLAVATLLKDEEDCLELWLDYHLAQGVEHFYLYDNGSSDRDRLERLCEPYRRQGLVTLIDFDPYGVARGRPQDKSRVQPAQLNHAVYRHPSDRWLALIDVDEFLVPARDATIAAWLGRLAEERPEVGAVAVPCRWFGCGATGLERDELRRSDYVFRLRRRRREIDKLWTWKMVVEPASVQCAQVHEVLCRPGKRRLRATPADAVMHHYRTVSRWAERECDCRVDCAVPDDTIERYRGAVEAIRARRAEAELIRAGRAEAEPIGALRAEAEAQRRW